MNRAVPFSRFFRRIRNGSIGRRLNEGYISIRYKLLALFLSFFLLGTAVITSVVFVFVSNMTKQNSSVSNANLISHIGDTIAFLINEVSDMSLFFLTNEGLITLLSSPEPRSPAMVQKREEVYRSLINRLAVGNNSIESVEILGVNGVSISMNKYYSNFLESRSAADAVKNLIGSADWTPDGQLGYFLNSASRLSFLRELRASDNLSRPLGNLLIHLRISRLDAIYQNRLLYENSALYIIDGNDLVITSNRKESAGTIFDPGLSERIRTNTAEPYFEFREEGKKAVLFFQRIAGSDWHIINMVMVDELLREYAAAWRFLVFTIALSSVGSILLVTHYLKKFLSPLANAALAMKEIERENYAIRISRYKNDEIGNMARSFNHMAEKLNALVKQVYAFEIKQRDTQITALRSQMNPHFLYNMLDIIVWKSRSEQAPATAELTRELSLYLRKSITETKPLVTVEDELEYLSSYLNLQKIRLGDTVAFEISVEDGCRDCCTIGSVLQPLVENAINHGILSGSGVGQVTVRIAKQENMLVIEVEDDGSIDIDPANLECLMAEESGESRGFAIRNINDRIRLMFGEEWGLHFQRSADGLTLARVEQPFTIPEK